MKSILDYVARYHHLSLAEKPLNDIDALILTELLYLPIDTLVSKTFHEQISLRELGHGFLVKEDAYQTDNPFLATEIRMDLMKLCFRSERYGGVKLCAFINEIDDGTQKQIAAVTFMWPQGQLLVAFRGTDDTLIGWREDFALSYQEEIPAHCTAIAYLTQLLQHWRRPVWVSGHSKGGHLAVVASSCVAQELQHLILRTISFDGPGFNRHFLASPGFLALTKRVQFYVPEETIVGQLMYRTHQPTIIASRQSLLEQHLTTNWLIEDDQFVTLETTSSLSQLVDKTFKLWIEDRSPADLRLFFETIFTQVEVAGVSSLNQVDSDFWGVLNRIRQAIGQEDPDLRQRIEYDLSQLFRIAADQVVDEQSAQMKITLNKWLKWLADAGDVLDGPTDYIKSLIDKWRDKDGKN